MLYEIKLCRTRAALSIVADINDAIQLQKVINSNKEKLARTEQISSLKYNEFSYLFGMCKVKFCLYISGFSDSHFLLSSSMCFPTFVTISFTASIVSTAFVHIFRWETCVSLAWSIFHFFFLCQLLFPFSALSDDDGAANPCQLFPFNSFSFSLIWRKSPWIHCFVCC